MLHVHAWPGLFSLCLFLLFTATNVFAQQPAAGPDRRSVTAVRLGPAESVTLDGELQEEFWQRVEPARDFMQIDPENGQPATEPTEVRIVYTADAIYMAVTCFDSEPDKWLGYQRRRDEFLQADDRFQWTI
jgi:hypothetical protein